MKNFEEFSKYFQSLSNTELVEIIDNPQNYQSSAVESAIKELQNRQISETNLQTAREPLITRQAKQEADRKNLNALESKIKSTGFAIADSLNPLHIQTPSVNKKIRLIIVCFTAIWLYMVTRDFSMLTMLFKELGRLDLQTLFYLSPYLIIPIASFLFWARKQGGWILLVFYNVFNGLLIVSMLLKQALRSGSDAFDYFGLYSASSLVSEIVALLFTAGMVYVLCKQDIRNVFKIEKSSLAATFLISGILTFLVTHFLF